MGIWVASIARLIRLLPIYVMCGFVKFMHMCLVHPILFVQKEAC